MAPLHSQNESAGLREPAWSPDGKRLAVVYLDRIWTMQPDGRDARGLLRETTPPIISEREPAWSPDGRRLAFAGDAGDGFRIYVAAARGGEPEPLTAMPGDSRSPSWAADGRIVFAHREVDSPQWDIYAVDPDARGVERTPQRLTQSADSEIHPRVSPDGRRVVFASDRESDDGDFDIWVMRLVSRTE